MDTEPLRPPAATTGDSRVDEAIARLAALREAPLDEHPPVLEAVHDKLREILGELGDAGGPRPARPGERGEQGQLSPGWATPRNPPQMGFPGQRHPGR